MARMSEPLYMVRNRKTGKCISSIDYGTKPPEPIYENAYHPPKLFCAYNVDSVMRVAGLDSDLFEKVTANVQLGIHAEPGETDATVSAEKQQG